MTSKTKKMDNFCASVLVCVLVPLVPLFVYSLFSGIRYTDLLLTAALYPVSLFLQSTSKALFATSICMLIFFSLCLANKQESRLIFINAIITIAVVAVIHLIERYRLHVVHGKKFFQFN